MLNKVLVSLLSRECALQYFTALIWAQSNGAKHQINSLESGLVQIVDGRHWQLSRAELSTPNFIVTSHADTLSLKCNAHLRLCGSPLKRSPRSPPYAARAQRVGWISTQKHSLTVRPKHAPRHLKGLMLYASLPSRQDTPLNYGWGSLKCLPRTHAKNCSNVRR